MRFVVAEPGTALVSFDQEKWARAMDYGSQSLEGALGLFRAIRAATTEVLRRAPRAAWEHAGINTEAALKRSSGSSSILRITCLTISAPSRSAGPSTRGRSAEPTRVDGTPAVGGPRQVRAPRGTALSCRDGPKRPRSGCS